VEESLKSLRGAVEKLRGFNSRRARTDPDLEMVRTHPGFAELVGAGATSG
jgi:hypothetical protein